MAVTLSEIRAAAAAIDGAVSKTPFLKSQTLSKITGAREVWIKFENLQFTSSFKERGALNKLLGLSADQRARGVIAMSAGNHAQGVAYHAARLSIPATIVMPEGTPFVKAKQTEDHGATVLLKGANLSESAAFAEALAAERGFTFVHPYDDDCVIAGQGTIGLEIADSGIDLDALVVPIGGGGLIAGVATAMHALKPHTQIIGVEADQFPAMKCLLEGREPIFGGATIAEGIAVRRIGERALGICRDLVKSIVLVPEADIERAIYLFLTIEKTLAEGAGAAGLAALLAEPARFRGSRVGLILCGGNIDPRLLSSVILRELMRDGRIFQIAVEAEDLPGQLSRVTGAVGRLGGSILEVQHSRLALDIPAKHTVIELLIEAKDRRHGEDIAAAIKGLGMRTRPV